MSNDLRRRKKFNMEPYMFISLTVILFVAMLLVPFIQLIIYSFADASISKGIEGWQGLKNYKYLLTSEFLHTLKVTAIYLIGSMVGMIIFGMALALALNKPIFGRTFFRALLIIPWVIPHAFAGTMWRWALHPHYGLINNILRLLGMETISFLSYEMALPTIVVNRIWNGTPFMVMSLLAALQTIPEEVEEAALLDGATGFSKFRHITFPLIQPILTVTSLILGAWTLRVFDNVFVLTGGGPANATKLISISLYEKAFLKFDLGTASVIAIFTMVAVVLLSLPSLRDKEDIL